MVIGNHSEFITGTHFYRYVFLQFVTCQLERLNLKTYNTKRYLLIHKYT